MLSRAKIFVFPILFCHLIFAVEFASSAEGSRYDFFLRDMRYSADPDFVIRDESTFNTIRNAVQVILRSRRTDRERVDLKEELMAALILKIVLYHTQRFSPDDFNRAFGSPPAAMSTLKRMLVEYLDPGRILFTESEISHYMADPHADVHFAEFKNGNWDEIYALFPVYAAALTRYRSLAFDGNDSESVANAMNLISAGKLHTPIIENLIKRLEYTRRIEADEFDAVELAIVEQRADVEDRSLSVEGKYGKMDSLFAAVLSGLDRYSRYLFGAQYRMYKLTRPSPKNGTLGVYALQALSGLYIEKVYLNMAGFTAGLRKGDIIVSIDGESLADLPYNAQLQRMRGAPGTVALLEILRDGERFKIEVPRGKRLATFADVVERNGRKLGYLEIGEFSATSAAEVAEQLAWLEGQNIEGLVLDLRDNMGGHLHQAVDTAVQFLGEVAPFGYVAQVGSGDEIPSAKTFMQYSTKGRSLKFSKPLVVLTSAATVSAGELLTMILKDHRRAVVMGARTFGKGVIQAGDEIPSVHFKNNRTGRYVRVKESIAGLFFVNSAYFVDSRGQSPQAVGVEPDIVLFEDKPFDPVRDAGINPAALSVPPLKSISRPWISESTWNALLDDLRVAAGSSAMAAEDDAKIRETAFSALQRLIETVGPDFAPPAKPEETNPFKRACQTILTKIGAR